MDPTSTKPGLVPGAAEMPTVNMRCKKVSFDGNGQEVRCDSITAVEIKLPPQSGARMYRCTKCGYTHNMQVGGFFPY